MKDSAMLSLLLIFLFASVKCASTCSDLNPFLDLLSRHKGILLDHPQKDLNSGCGLEWEQHGTCCNIKPLREIALKDKKRNNKAVALIIKSLRLAVGSTQLIYHRFQTFSKHLGDIGKQLIQMRKQSHKQISKHLNIIIELKLVSCSKKVTHVRSVSLCYICSSQSSNFFFKDKALVNEDLCSYYLQDCVQPIHMILDMIDALNRVIEVTKAQFKQIYLKSTSGDLENEILHMRETLFSNDEFKLITDYLQASDETAKKHHLTQVCSLLVSLSHKTFLQNMSTALQNYISKLQNLINNLQSAIVSNYKRKLRRVLHEETAISSTTHEGGMSTSSETHHHMSGLPTHESQQWLANKATVTALHIQGDVVLFSPANIDSSYTSFFGAVGTSGNELSSHFRSMPVTSP